jgi:hypothetical protein
MEKASAPSSVPNAVTMSSNAQVGENTPFNDYEFEQAKEPPFSWLEAFRFFAWAILLTLSQLRSDIKERHNSFKTFFMSDLLSHFFVCASPRLNIV